MLNTTDENGNKLELAVLRPGHKIMQEATMAYNLKVSQLIRKGSEGEERLLLKSEVEEHLIKSGVWSSKDTSRMEQLGIRTRAIELIIQRGGIKMSDARKLALEMSQARAEMLSLYAKKQQLDFATVESVAEQYKFGVLMTRCLVFASDGGAYLSSYDDYMEKGGDIAVIEGAKCLAKMVYGMEDDINMSFYENRWLKDHSFVDDNGRLIDKEGNFVDKSGQRVDKIGKYIDKDGNFITQNGVRVDENGSFIIEDAKPFLDDDGNPIINNNGKTKKSRKNKRKAKTAK